jgi:predicted acetyltransferase
VDHHYAPLADEPEEIRIVSDILGWSFSFPPVDAEPWLRRGGFENVRVLRRGVAPVASLMIVPMGQFFGGRSVAMAGIAGVATAPEARGTGAATMLMQSTVKELHAAGWLLSTLYPATRPLYRRAGYEPAGGRFEITARLSQISMGERRLTVRPIEPTDEANVILAYTEHARDVPGHLDRGEYIWSRIRNPRGEVGRGYLIERGGRVDGYVYMYQKRVAPPEFDLRVTDLVALSPETARRLLTFLADHASTGANVSWFTGPGGTLVQMLPEVGYEQRLHDHWMLRVLNVPSALAARGYPEGLEVELHLEVTDELIPQNQGRFVLQIANGRGEVKKGGRGDLKLDVRGLAPLYTSHLPPASLAASGLIEASPPALARASAAFGGPAPWMPEIF